MTMYDGKEMYKGILFLKSMKSDENLIPDAVDDAGLAMKAGIKLETVFVDDNYSKSVDRDEICKLLEFLDGKEQLVLAVEDIHDITDDASDLRLMMDRINSMGIIIFELRTMSARFNNYKNEC